MRTYDPMAGERIDQTCATLVAMAVESGEPCRAEFNGVEVVARPGMTAGDLQQGWSDEMDRRRKAYQESPAGRAAAARAEASQRRAAESAAKGIVDFDVADQESWQKCLEANRDGGYGECVLRYAARWASMIDAAIKEGAKVVDVAKQTSRDADTEGITGFMYGCAVSMLVKVWRHGEELRRWHNLDTQIGNEGEKANESGGVLNPAVLNIG